MENSRTGLSRMAEHASLLDALPCAMYIVSANGHITAANRAFRELAGVEASGHGEISRDIFNELEFYTAEGLRVPREDWPSLHVLRTGQQINQQIEIRLRGTFTAWVVIAGGPLFDGAGAVTAAVMSITNITEQKTTEQQLRQRNDELALAQQVARCGMFSVDLRTSSIAVSTGFASLCGRALDDANQPLQDWLECIDPAERPAFVERLTEAWAHDEDLPFALRRTDTGESRWMTARGHVVRDEDGVPRQLLGFLIDATELKSAQDRYRTLTETIPVGLATGHIAGPDYGVITFANQAYLDLCGRTREELERGEVRWTDHTPEHWRACDMEAVRQVRATGRSEVYEKEIVHRDGTAIPVEVAVARFTSGTEAVASVRDITERKRLEDELRRRDAEKTAIFNAVPAGLSVVTNTPERWREVNPAWLRMQGFRSLADMRAAVAMGHHRLLYPSGEPIPFEEWPSTITLRTGQQVAPFEIVVKRHDGVLVPAIASAAPALDPKGNVFAAVVSIVEITEQKLVEESLRKRESERDAMLRALPTGMCVLDAQQQVIESNRMWVEIFGFGSVEETIGKPPFSREVVRRFAPDGSPISHDEWVSSIVLRSGAPLRDVEMLCERQDSGQQCVVLFSAAPVMDSSGRIERVVVTAQDITQLKRAEETARLRTEQLASSNEELQAFAYTASHDLQEPLRTVALYAELLDRRCPLQEGPCQTFRQTIRGNALRMQEMLQSLLTYSQIAQSDRPKVAVDIKRVIERALHSLESSRMHGDEIVFGDMPVVNAWEGRLEQVFQNLIGNALKYRKPGEPVHISITCKPEGLQWLFEIRDDGIGFKPDYAERIFGIFRRLHGRSEYSGTGIGLTIVRRIVERHAGRIWAEGREGQGSTFYFTLPKWG